MKPHSDSDWTSHDDEDRIDELFGTAHALSPTERARFLDDACAGAPDQRAAVERLLAALDEPLGILAEAERGPGPGSVLSALPERIGEFRVLAVLGRGGMGVVYRAEQDQPRRHVALKVLLPGEVGTDGLARLEQEAEILGRLQHPGIAQVFGAGSFESALGRQPYLTLELIEGLPLASHCAERSLTVRARCELLAMVCDAVQHAHERGVIHRDLKPSNVLVAIHGEAYVQPKVLDFGVARLVDLEQQRARTMQTGEFVGTLSYMSPEQFLHGRASAGSDVYSLGVMLYELLAWRLPLDYRGRSITDIQHLLERVEPEPLPRSADVPPDLRTIVATALAKDPAERYPSAAELAAELRRWLANEPIRARPTTLVYQLGKFTRRNRTFVAGVAATGLALIAGTVVALSLLVAARRATSESRRNEYISQLRAASALWLNDPDEARVALDRVADRAGLEWRLLAARLDPFVLTCPTGAGRPEDAERQAVHCAANGEARFFYVSSADHVGHLLDARTGIERWRYPFGETPEAARTAAFSRSGDLLASTAAGPTGLSIVVLRTADGEVVHRVAVDGSSETASAAGVLTQIVFTADERFLVWSPPPKGSRGPIDVHVLELSSGSMTTLPRRRNRNEAITPHAEGPSVWLGHRHRLSAENGDALPVLLDDQPRLMPARVSVHPLGTYFALIRRHLNVVVQDARGEEVFALNGLRARPREALFHGDMVAATTVRTGGGMRIWDLRSGRSMRAVPTDALTACFSSDGSDLLAVTTAGAGWVDVALRMTGHSDFIVCGAQDATGRLLATGDTSGQLRLWDLDTAMCCAVLELGPARFEALEFEADGRTLWCRTQDTYSRYSVRRIDLVRWEAGPPTPILPKAAPVAPPGVPPALWQVERYPRKVSIVCRDGRTQTCEPSHLAGDGAAFEVVIVATDGSARTRHIALADVPLLAAYGPVLCIDDEERWLAVGLGDGSLNVFDLESGRVMLCARRHQGPIDHMLMLADERRLVTAGFDGTLRFWDIDSWREVYSEQGHERSVEGLLTTPDGSRLVTWSADRTVRIWDTKLPSERNELLAKDADPRRAAEAWVDRLWDELGDGDLVAERIDAEAAPSGDRMVWALERHLAHLTGAR